MDNSTFVPPIAPAPPLQMDNINRHHEHSKMAHTMPMLERAIPFVNTDDNPSAILSCTVVVLLCFVMEAARWARMNREESRKISRNTAREQITARHLPEVILHCLQLTCSYLLMLVFMRGDVALCAATVAGEVIARLFCASYLPINVAPKKISFIDTQ